MDFTQLLLSLFVIGVVIVILVPLVAGVLSLAGWLRMRRYRRRVLREPSAWQHVCAFIALRWSDWREYRATQRQERMVQAWRRRAAERRAR